MIFDTDVLIWVERGSGKAAKFVEKSENKSISIQTYMELMQCAKNKDQQKYTRDFLTDFGFEVLPFTENIGHRAAIYIEQFSLATGLRAGDAVIAATAVENRLPLSTCNKTHFVKIPGLELHIFNP